MKRKKTIAFVTCSCGGKLKPVRLATHDLIDYTGLEGTIENVPGFRCTKCKGENLDGQVINDLLRMVAVRICAIPTRLPPEAARYLRRVFGGTQKDMATTMAVNRVTVAKWECGDEPISPHHDSLLRAIAMMPLIRSGFIPDKDVDALLATFGAVRIAAPTAMTPIDLGPYRPMAQQRRAAAP